MILRFLLSLVIRLPKNDRHPLTVIGKNRLRIAKIFDFLFPAETNSFPERPPSFPLFSTGSGIVLGFNHFSLGEIPRLVSICFKSYPTKDLLFPVNFEFYSYLNRSKDYLAALGIELLPILTPRVYQKMIEKARTDEEKREIEAKQHKFSRQYLERAIEVLEEGGVVLIAPSRTRQKTVFNSEEEFLGLKPVPPVLRLIAMAFFRKFPDQQLDFIPIPIIPPSHFSRGLNLFRKYYFPACFYGFKPIVAKRADFDHGFLSYIASQLPEEFSYPS